VQVDLPEGEVLQDPQTSQRVRVGVCFARKAAESPAGARLRKAREVRAVRLPTVAMSAYDLLPVAASGVQVRLPARFRWRRVVIWARKASCGASRQAWTLYLSWCLETSREVSLERPASQRSCVRCR